MASRFLSTVSHVNSLVLFVWLVFKKGKKKIPQKTSMKHWWKYCSYIESYWGSILAVQTCRKVHEHRQVDTWQERLNALIAITATLLGGPAAGGGTVLSRLQSH